MATLKNPFVVGGYVSAEYFCDRREETKELIGAFLNERNMVIVSPRRMGKTGLIEHCFQQKEIQSQHYTFFIDIYATGSLKELVFALGKQIFNTLKPHGRKLTEQFFNTISSLRPAFKLDQITGQPVFDIGIGEIRQPALSLEEIFEYLEKADRRCIVAIDEFQQIAKYPEKNIEALLRTHIQKCKNTTFVFAGSQRHMMQNIFFSPSRPFYQSAFMLILEPIDQEEYSKFIHSHFSKANKTISNECIKSIYLLLEGHTWYIQSLCNRLYELTDNHQEITFPFVNKVLHKTVEAGKSVYQSMVSMLTERQKEILFAIAKEGKATEINSASFIKKHGLYSASSVQSSAKQLLEKELITKDNNGTYCIYDRFFGFWLAENYGTGYKMMK